MVPKIKNFLIPGQNKLLPLILIISLWLNTTGLIPNTFFHQNEPGLLGPSDQLFKNIINRFDFDPNIPPDAFKYASILFYSQAFTRGGTLFLIYETNKLFNFDFGKPERVFKGSFSEFVSDNGPLYFESHMLWASRLWGVLFGTGSVYLTYLIALKLFKHRSIALLSAAALALMPLHVRNSHYALADMPQVFFFLLSFLACIIMYEKQTTRSYLFAGFLVGFSTSLKYFPLSLLPFLIFHALIDWRNLLSKNFFSALLAIFFGYWVGMPYLFVHFNEIIGFIPYALTWYGPDKLQSQASILEKLLPHSSHAYHLKFLFKDAMLPLPFFASIIGLFFGLKKYSKATLLALIIPFATGIFIFFYVKQIYEQLPMPMLPFLAIFVGIFAYSIISLKIFPRKFLIAITILSLFLPSFISSAQASLACSTPITEYRARDWVRNNIPKNSNFAFEPGSRLPSELEINWFKSEVNENFSLSELQDINAKYLMIMNGYYGVNLSWSYDTLFPPKNILDNQYVQSVINEYKDQAILLKEFVKPYMCISNNISIYEIPPKLAPGSKIIRQFNFSNPDDFKYFNLTSTNEETILTNILNKGNTSSGSLNYSYSNSEFNHWRNEYYFFYATPAKSAFMEIQPNKKYTFEAWIFPETEFKKKVKDFYLRTDYYNDRDNSPIKTVLSSRTKNLNVWQKLSVTSIAPQGTKFITIGFQSLAAEISGRYLVDDLTLYEE